jgi:hypothetical protein
MITYIKRGQVFLQKTEFGIQVYTRVPAQPAA